MVAKALSNETPISLTLFKLFISKISTLITYLGQYYVRLPTIMGMKVFSADPSLSFGVDLNYRLKGALPIPQPPNLNYS